MSEREGLQYNVLESGDVSQTAGKLFAAMAKAQAKIEGAKKDSLNPHFKSKYADLASVWEACRKELSEQELCVIQTTRPSQTGVHVVTWLCHSSGEWIRGELFIPATKPDAQGFGSAITYARRFALAAIVGIAPEDDDGEAAVKRTLGKVPNDPQQGQAASASWEVKLIAANPEDMAKLATELTASFKSGAVTRAQYEQMKAAWGARQQEMAK